LVKFIKLVLGGRERELAEWERREVERRRLRDQVELEMEGHWALGVGYQRSRRGGERGYRGAVGATLPSVVVMTVEAEGAGLVGVGFEKDKNIEIRRERRDNIVQYVSLVTHVMYGFNVSVIEGMKL